MRPLCRVGGCPNYAVNASDRCTYHLDFGPAPHQQPETPRGPAGGMMTRKASVTVVEIETTTGGWAAIAEFHGPDQNYTNRRAIAWGEQLLGGFSVGSRPRVQIVDGDGKWLGAWSPLTGDEP